nr:ABC transporter permease [Acuticoccus mangrovi]
MAGASTSLGVAALAVAIGVAFGVPLGLLAASGGRWVDAVVMRSADLAFAFPALIVAVILTTLLGASAMNAAIAVGIFNVPVFARLAAAGGRRVLALDFIDAARLSGKGRARIALEHVAPNIAPVVLTQAATQFAIAILAEAGLSYVGLGAQPPTVSWGRMLNEAQTMIAIAPQLAVWPGLAIVAAVLAITTFAEGLRARLDPRFARAVVVD